MIGTRPRWAPSRWATSKPSMSGSITSSTIRSGLKARHRGERLGAGAGGLDREALEAQGHRDDVDDVRLVVDDEHAVGGGGFEGAVEFTAAEYRHASL